MDQTTGVFEYHFAVGAEKYCETIRLPPGYYNTMKELLTKINSAIGVVLNGKKPKEEWPVFKYDDISRKATINLKKGDVFQINDELKYILGITSTPHTWSNSATFTGEEVCDIDGKVTSLFVYCDILEHVPIGDVKAPLLRTVGVNGKFGEIVRCIFDKPLYVPVQKKNFESIEIDIRTDTGDRVPFESGKSSVTLHFKLSKNPYFLQ